MSDFSVTTERQDQHHVVQVSGELDMATEPVLAKCLAELDGTVRLDCSGLSFIDSRGISLLITTDRRLRDGGGRLEIHRMSKACRRPLELMDLHEVLHFAD